MKAVIVEEYGHAELKEIPLRAVGHEEVKVRIVYCGIGGLDPYIISGEVPLELPWHLGYQASGVIEVPRWPCRSRLADAIRSVVSW